MEPNAKSRLAGSVRTALKSVKATELGWLDISLLSSPELEPAEKIVAQHKKDLLSKDRARWLLLEAISGELQSRNVKVIPSQGLTEILSDAEIENVAAAVADYIAGLPHPLEVTCPFPQIDPLLESIHVTSELRIESRNLAPLLIQPRPRTVAVSKVSAIPMWMFSDSAVALAFEQVRVLLGIWLAMEVLSVDPPGLSSLLTFSAPRKESYEVVDLPTGNTLTNSSAEIARRGEYVSRMRFDKRTLERQTGESTASSRAIAKLVATTCGPVFEDEPLRTEAAGLMSASHWFFESGLADDETSRFIFACIGIDAIAGGADQSQSLSQRVADRASHILCRRPSQRADMAKRLIKIFQTRGKVVHGQVQKLVGDDLALAREARMILGLLIRTELRNLVPGPL